MVPVFGMADSYRQPVPVPGTTGTVYITVLESIAIADKFVVLFTRFIDLDYCIVIRGPDLGGGGQRPLFS